MQMAATCGTWLFSLQVVGRVWSCGLCVRFAEYIPQTGHITHSSVSSHIPSTFTPTLIILRYIMSVVDTILDLKKNSMRNVKHVTKFQTDSRNMLVTN